MWGIAKHAPHAALTNPAGTDHSIHIVRQYTGHTLYSPDNVKLDKTNVREVRALAEATDETQGMANAKDSLSGYSILLR